MIYGDKRQLKQLSERFGVNENITRKFIMLLIVNKCNFIFYTFYETVSTDVFYETWLRRVCVAMDMNILFS